MASRIDCGETANDIGMLLGERAADIPSADRLAGHRIHIGPAEHLADTRRTQYGGPGIEFGNRVHPARISAHRSGWRREFRRIARCSRRRRRFSTPSALATCFWLWMPDTAIRLPARSARLFSPEFLQHDDGSGIRCLLIGHLILGNHHQIKAAFDGGHRGARDRQDEVDIAAAMRGDRLVAVSELDQLRVEPVLARRSWPAWRPRRRSETPF